MMSDTFFKKPIRNSPYEYPSRHWQLDDSGLPTHSISNGRRKAQFITPIPKPKKHKDPKTHEIFDESLGLGDGTQKYDLLSLINELRSYVDQWRALPNERDWLVTPETARLLKHWRGQDNSHVYADCLANHQCSTPP